MEKSRRILAVLLFAAMVIAFIPVLRVSAESDSGTCGENLTWELDSETGVLTISGTGNMSNMHIFDKGVYIASPWEDRGVTSVIIEEGVTSIGNSAFYACGALESVTIPGSVTYR